MASKGAHSHKYRFVKTMGLRHKPTMDWGMRARARNQVHWDKYWNQFEPTGTSGASATFGDDGSLSVETKANQDPSKLESLAQPLTNCDMRTNNTAKSELDGMQDVPLGPDRRVRMTNTSLLSEPLVVRPDDSFTPQSTTAGGPAPEDDSGYHFFQQVLNHFPNTTVNNPPPNVPRNESASTTQSDSILESSSLKNMTTFRQYYHVSSEFYKPGTINARDSGSEWLK